MLEHPAVIKAENLIKDYKTDFWKKKQRVLTDVTFCVNEGEVFGFLGLNGAGKTTTIKILMNVIYPTRGRALLFDRPVTDVAVKAKLGYLPENPYFYDYLKAYEILDFYGRLFGMAKPTREKKIDELLELVGLAKAKHMPLRRFSKGMLQRIGLAQALINDPSLVVLDEPQSGLDPIGRKDVRDIILELKRRGKTVFFSSHILPDVEMICDRIAIIHEGKLVDVGYVGDLIDSQLKRIEIHLAIEGADQIASLKKLATQMEVFQNRVSLEVSDEKSLTEVIDLARTQRLSVITVNRHKETLEDIFLRKIGIANKI